MNIRRKMRKAALHNLGCKVNSYETEAMEELLRQDGFEIVPFDEYADVYVVNTCSVTNIADRKSRQMLHKCKKINPDACLVATGCYIQNFGKDIPEELGCDIILGNNKKGDLVQKLHEFFAENTSAGPILDFEDINQAGISYESMHIEKDSEHTRAFVKVQDGCNQFCTYCIIPFARGRIRSRSIEDVVEEITGLGHNGYREVVITGIHLSSFGAGTDYSLADLLEAVNEIEGIDRIRLGSLEPQIVTEDFAARVSRLEKLCPHFHLSMQSGCDTVLKRMNRRYTSAEYKKGCCILRKFFDNPAITTDVIVGFPGETEEEFQETYGFVQEISFYEMHVFQYSKRAGTKAATMPNQIPGNIKKSRSAALLAVDGEKRKAYLMDHIGQNMDILFEEKITIDNADYYVGFSREYIKCALLADGRDDLRNKIVKAKAYAYMEEQDYLIVEI